MPDMFDRWACPVQNRFLQASGYMQFLHCKSFASAQKSSILFLSKEKTPLWAIQTILLQILSNIQVRFIKALALESGVECPQNCHELLVTDPSVFFFVAPHKHELRAHLLSKKPRHCRPDSELPRHIIRGLNHAVVSNSDWFFFQVWTITDLTCCVEHIHIDMDPRPVQPSLLPKQIDPVLYLLDCFFQSFSFLRYEAIFSLNWATFISALVVLFSCCAKYLTSRPLVFWSTCAIFSSSTFSMPAFLTQ